MNRQKNRFIRANVFIHTILIIIIVVALVLGEALLPRDSFFDDLSAETYAGKWYHITSDGKRTKATVPVNYNLPANEILSMETTLPDGLVSGTYLCFRSNRQDMNIYLNNKRIHSYTTKDNQLFPCSSAGAYVFVELLPEYSGQLLRVDASTNTAYSGMFSTVLYGSKANIWATYIRQSILEVIIALFALVLGFACTIIGLFLNKIYHYYSPLAHLGTGSFLASIWVFTNSDLRQLIFPNLALVSDIPFFVIMVLPIPVLLYMNTIQKDRYHKVYYPLLVATYVELAIFSLLHMSGIYELAHSIVIIEVFVFLIIAICILTIIKDIVTKNVKEYLYPAVGIIFVFVAVSIQMILYLRHVFSFNGMMMCSALFFIMVSTAITVIREVRRMDSEREQAIVSSHAKAQFLARMSHEIRTPINAVLGMDEMILRESSEPAICDYALDIQKAGKSLLSLINDILDYSKIESNRLDIVEIDYSLSSLVSDCYNMVYLRSKEKGLEFIIEGASNLPSLLHGDEVRIRQIILNLLTNAIKYTSEGSITLSISGKKVRNDQFNLLIQVSDTGMGIKREDISRLFDSFTRIDEFNNHSIEGTGLGLAIVHQLLELMGGTICVDSTYQKGSTFSVMIPQKIVGNQTIEHFSINPKENSSGTYSYTITYTAPNARILIVDDVEMNLKVFSGLLKPTKARIETVQSGKECLELISKRKYDIIFLDHMMPEMDGIETFQQIKQSKNHPNTKTPIVMLTANALSGAREEYLSLGFVDYLSKPIQQDLLDKILLEHLPKQFIVKASGKSKSIPKRTTSNLTDEPKDSSGLSSSMIASLNQFIDATKTLDYCGGSKELYLEMLKSFVADADFEAIKAAYESTDLTRYQTYIHAIKSSAAYIGANDLSAEAKRLEAAITESKFDYIQAHHNDLLESYQKYVERISRIIESSRRE